MSSSTDPRMPTNTTLIKEPTRQNNMCIYPSVVTYPPEKPFIVHAHPLGPLDFFAPSLRVNFFLGGARPSPPGGVAVGEGAALGAALLLIL